MSEQQDPTLPQSPPLPDTPDAAEQVQPDRGGLPMPMPQQPAAQPAPQPNQEGAVPAEPQPDAGTPNPYPQSGQSAGWTGTDVPAGLPTDGLPSAPPLIAPE